MDWKLKISLGLSFVLAISTIVVAFENANLTSDNIQLSRELHSTQQELNKTNQTYFDLKELFGANKKGDLSPPIETRLGIKVVDGIRYPNYLWITGQVENIGNLTLFNAKLRFTLYTTNGTDVKEDVIGTMLSQETIDVRDTIFSSLGAITSWKLETVATYQP